MLQHSDVNNSPTHDVPSIVYDVLRSPGQPLDATTRAFMEPGFGRDFSGVRVHTDANASESAGAVNALAYTVGSHIAFGSGQFAPHSNRGRRLMAHELTHVVQQGEKAAALNASLVTGSVNSPLEGEADRVADIITAGQTLNFPITTSGLSILRQSGSSPTFTRQSQIPGSQDFCENERDITQTFRAFVSAVPALISQIAGLAAGEQIRLTTLADTVLHSEGSAAIDRFRIVVCDRINSTLTLPGEQAEAFVDVSNQKVGLHQTYMDRINEFSQTPTRESLLPILSVIAHEKRHATLGSAVSVSPADLQPQLSPSQAGQAAYRVEEILTVAEEIAVERRFSGESFSVSISRQRHLQRLWNTVRGWVTSTEAERLRNVIIQQLRLRYSTQPNCDNSITLGVLTAMELGVWYLCDRGTGHVVGTIPRGLNLCEQDGRHRVCGSAP